MRQILHLLLVASMFLAVCELQAQKLAVLKKNGSQDVNNLITVRSIKFQGTMLSIFLTDGQTTGYLLADISKIYFNPVISANNSLAFDNSGVLSVYPNPAIDKLFLRNLNEDNAIFSIYRIDGTTVMNGTLNAQNNIVDISLLATGIYILRVNNQAVKFIKK